MPRYDFLNTNTNEIEEHTMSWKVLDEFKQNNPHLKQQISAMNIVGGTGDRVKTDGGFNDVLQKIAATQPDTPMGERYHRKSAKEVKTREVIKKHVDLQNIK
jgi:hypothetical protein